MKNAKTIPLPRDLIQFIFEAAYIQRWNDHIRPQGFTELDKQAHKMMILYVLARYEEQDHMEPAWTGRCWWKGASLNSSTGWCLRISSPRCSTS